MKILLSLLMISFSIAQLSGQDESLELKIVKSKGASCYILVKDNQILDSLLLSYTNSSLIDYKIISEEKVIFISKNFDGYYYYNLEKKQNEPWQRSITTGKIGINYERRGKLSRAQMELLNVEYKILEEDKVLVKNGDDVQVFECSRIADFNNAWLKRIDEARKKN